MPHIMIVADDLTGALDTGVQFTKNGARVFVSIAGHVDINAFCAPKDKREKYGIPNCIVGRTSNRMDKNYLNVRTSDSMPIENVEFIKCKITDDRLCEMQLNGEHKQDVNKKINNINSDSPIKSFNAEINDENTRGRENRTQYCECDVLVVNAETRHIEPRQAAERVRTLLRQAVRLGFTHFYKKTDSALRGNVGSELAAMLEATGAPSLAFAPSYPKYSRVTLNGIHYINGVPLEKSIFACDPFEPAMQSEVAKIIGVQTDVPVINVGIAFPRPSEDAKRGDVGGGAFIEVFDAETDDDLMNLGRYLQAHDKLRCLAGCAGFAEVLPGLYGFKTQKQNKSDVNEAIDMSDTRDECDMSDSSNVLDTRDTRDASGRQSILLVTGSVNETTFGQINRAEDAGFYVIKLTPEQKIGVHQSIKSDLPLAPACVIDDHAALTIAIDTNATQKNALDGHTALTIALDDNAAPTNTLDDYATQKNAFDEYAALSNTLDDHAAYSFDATFESKKTLSETSQSLIDDIAAALESHRRVAVVAALSHDDVRETDEYANAIGLRGETLRRRICAGIGDIIAKVLMRRPPDALVVFGGDTLYEILGRAAIKAVIPVDEPAPGIVGAEVMSDTYNFKLVTKSGGLGGDDAIGDIVSYLSR